MKNAGLSISGSERLNPFDTITNFMYQGGILDSQSSREKAYFAFLCIGAEKGNTDAQENLGFAYYCRIGVERDYHKAAEWYLKVANQDDYYSVASQYHLGKLYEEGTRRAVAYQPPRTGGKGQTEYAIRSSPKAVILKLKITSETYRKNRKLGKKPPKKKRAEAMRIYSSAENNEANGNLEPAPSQSA